MKNSLLFTALSLSFAATAAVAQPQTQKYAAPDARILAPARVSGSIAGMQNPSANSAAPKADAPKAKAESGDVWLCDHLHQAVVNGNETDYYSKHDDEGVLRQMHQVTKNDDGTYTHDYKWFMYVLGEQKVSRQVSAVNSSADDFLRGMTSEVRFGTNRTDEQFTMKWTAYSNGSQKPYLMKLLTYNYNDMGLVTDVECTLTDYNSAGEVVQERPFVKRTYEYGADMRPTRMVYVENAYAENTGGTEPYTLASTTTVTYTDVKYAGAANEEMPEDIGGDNWDAWMFGYGSNVASFSTAVDKKDYTDDSGSQNYTYTVTCTSTHDGDKRSFSSVTYRPDTGYWHKKTKRTTDALGSFVFEQQAYMLGAGEEPSDDNLNFSSKQTQLRSSANEYEETLEYFNPAYMTETRLMTAISQKAEFDPVYGYVTKETNTRKMYDVFEPDRAPSELEVTYTYDAYHRAGEKEGTSITSVSADDNARPTAIYNIMGQRLQKLQPGINIVNGKKIMVRK